MPFLHRFLTDANDWLQTSMKAEKKVYLQHSSGNWLQPHRTALHINSFRTTTQLNFGFRHVSRKEDALTLFPWLTQVALAALSVSVWRNRSLTVKFRFWMWEPATVMATLKEGRIYASRSRYLRRQMARPTCCLQGQIASVRSFEPSCPHVTLSELTQLSILASTEEREKMSSHLGQGALRPGGLSIKSVPVPGRFDKLKCFKKESSSHCIFPKNFWELTPWSAQAMQYERSHYAITDTELMNKQIATSQVQFCT